MLHGKTNVVTYLVALAILIGGTNLAQAVVILPNATPTINLASSNSSSGSIAYHPGFDQYYGGDAGNPAFPGYVWNSTGTQLQASNVSNVDFRSINYNPNTSAIEVATFNAIAGGTLRGLITMGLDGSGLYNGVNATALASVPGLTDSQSMPAYDAALNQLYSRSFTNIVNIASRATGALSGSIALDLASAGVVASDLVTYTLGYDPINNVLISLDRLTLRALIHDLSGAYLGASQLPNFGGVASAYSLGFANSQLFVRDTSTAEYRGFQIFGAAQVPEPGTIALFGLGLLGLGFTRRKKA